MWVYISVVTFTVHKHFAVRLTMQSVPIKMRSVLCGAVVLCLVGAHVLGTRLPFLLIFWTDKIAILMSLATSSC